MKVLVLHGYTQSGSGFQKKIRKLELRLNEVFGNSSTSFYYPNGIIQLRPSQMVVTGAHQDTDNLFTAQHTLSEKAHPDDIDCFAWFRTQDQDDPPYGFSQSLDMLAEILRTKGPFDGILGFSQGGLMAIKVASLLEGEVRRKAFEQAEREYPDTYPFPEAFKDLPHPPFKFGITYGAFMGVGKKYTPFYENPAIKTPFCQFSGLWDPVVSSEMKAAVERANIGGETSLKITHPGAHSVPTDAKNLEILVNFIKGLYNHDQPRVSIARQVAIKAIDFYEDSDTSSHSDESRFSSQYSRRRMGRLSVSVTRKKVRMGKPSHLIAQHRPEVLDFVFHSTSANPSSVERDGKYGKLDIQKDRLNFALEEFFQAWLQEEDLLGHHLSHARVKEIAKGAHKYAGQFA